MQSKVEEKINALPTRPGVYLMKDRKGVVFYIGKAKDLRARWRAYLTGSDERAFVKMLDSLLHDLEVVLTDTEKEALLLENDLIKQHEPRFNIKLTDDKNFLSLRIRQDEDYPRLEWVRHIARASKAKSKGNARYFGPYHSAKSIRSTVAMVNRYFKLRTCSDETLRSRTRPCLQYQIDRCPAPCVFEQKESYSEQVQHAMRFLDGDHSRLLQALREKMQAHSAALNFEAAADVRDQIRALERSLEKQKVIHRDFRDRDIFGFFRQGPEVEIYVMRVRESRLVATERFSFGRLEQSAEDILGDFLMRFYEGAEDLPQEVLLPFGLSWLNHFESVLTARSKRALKIMVPKRGDKKRLVRLAEKNAMQAMRDRQKKHEDMEEALHELQRRLRLKNLPRTWECVDISHTQGSQVVASVVRFSDGAPDKSGYRRYKVKTVQGQDDFGSIYEVVGRRVRRGLENADLPDLLIIDGGKGQVASAKAALDDHGVSEIDLIGLAKARTATGQKTQPQPNGKGSIRSFERVFVYGQKEPIIPRQNSRALLLLTQARDEAHRFAITFHRQLRSKAQKRSVLDSVPGIGPKKRALLLRHFGSVAKVREAKPEELKELVGEKLAGAIISNLQQKE